MISLRKRHNCVCKYHCFTRIRSKSEVIGGALDRLPKDERCCFTNSSRIRRRIDSTSIQKIRFFGTSTEKSSNDSDFPNTNQFTKGRRRIVVTGIGAVTPLGPTFFDSWSNLVRKTNDDEYAKNKERKTLLDRSDDSNQCSLVNESINRTRSSSSTDVVVSLEEALRRQQLPDEIFDAEWKLAKKLPPHQIAAPACFHEPFDHRTSRYIQLALRASNEALVQAGLIEWLGLGNNDDVKESDSQNDNNSSKDDSIYESRRDRCGVSIGTAMSSVRQIVHTSQLMFNSNYRKVSPYFVPNCLPNSAAARVALKYKLRGPNHCVGTACAAGGHSIGDSYRMLVSNNSNVDVMICGGTESCIDPISMVGFCRLQALATASPTADTDINCGRDLPEHASRPFDVERKGFVMAEGSAILVLEDLNHALRRKAPQIFAEVTGYSLTGDAYHVTSPDPSYHAAQACIEQALQQHRKHSHNSNGITYVNAHATSTQKGDEIEARCLTNVFANINISRDNASQLSIPSPPIFVSSTKGSTGHLLGAAGALEAAFSIRSLKDQIVPHTHNLKQIDPACNFENEQCDGSGLQHVLESPIQLQGTSKNNQLLEVAISNSFGFGGTNSCLVFQRFPTANDVEEQ